MGSESGMEGMDVCTLSFSVGKISIYIRKSGDVESDGKSKSMGTERLSRSHLLVVIPRIYKFWMSWLQKLHIY